jgi:hypothetical protein
MVRLRPAGEQLEARCVLTGGAGSMFAIVNGVVPTANAAGSHTFTIDPAQFTAPKRQVLLGVDVATATGSPLKPVVASVTRGDVAATAAAATPARAAARGALPTQRTTGNSAVIVTINRRGPAPETFTANIQGEGGTAGAFLLGYYLPGDADGDGLVSDADVLAVAEAKGTKAGADKYKFDADANRDGKIDPRDLQLTKANRGVRINVQPVFTAALDPISDYGDPDRVTIYQDAIFSGEAAPGAKVQFTETSGRTAAASTVAGADGKYHVTIALAEGANTFRVTSSDGFGQVISGTIAPVTYVKPPLPVASPTLPVTMPTPVPTPTPTPTPTAPGKTLTPMEQRIAELSVTRPDQAAKLREMLAAREAPKARTA